jgi:hypothetical protein
MDSSNSGNLDHPTGQTIHRKKKIIFHNVTFCCDEEAKRYKTGRKIPKEIFKHFSLVSSEGHVLSSITQTDPKVRN